MSSLYPPRKRAPEHRTTEFDVLKASHRFLRREEDDPKSWDAQLAKKYEDSLFKEFAVCDLKHYKSGNIALRWRTEDEVLSGAGEQTCGNTRCHHHNVQTSDEQLPGDSREISLKSPKLSTLELPFSYTENGEAQVREALVKVVLCPRCVKKLMWKREKDKKESLNSAEQGSSSTAAANTEEGSSIVTTGKADQWRAEPSHEYFRNERRPDNRNRSRSRSPKRYRAP